MDVKNKEMLVEDVNQVSEETNIEIEHRDTILSNENKADIMLSRSGKKIENLIRSLRISIKGKD